MRRSPNFQCADVARFHKYSDAEGYARILQRLDPVNQYEVTFDVTFDAGVKTEPSSSEL